MLQRYFTNSFETFQIESSLEGNWLGECSKNELVLKLASAIAHGRSARQPSAAGPPRPGGGWAHRPGNHRLIFRAGHSCHTLCVMVPMTVEMQMKGEFSQTLQAGSPAKKGKQQKLVPCALAESARPRLAKWRCASADVHLLI